MDIQVNEPGLSVGGWQKDRYTILSKKLLLELRTYFLKYRPKVYLFNGRKKGQKISEGAIRHALENARKRSGITREVTMHVLRHCFATHCLEQGMYIKKLFRGKLMAGILQLYKSNQLFLTPQMATDYKYIKNKLYKKEWVVYAKKAFGGPDQVLEYLGRYSHKICISNYRIVNITKTHVTFWYLGRKAKKSKTKTVKGEKFLRLFDEHILPKGFVKIRHIAFLCSRTKKTRFANGQRKS